MVLDGDSGAFPPVGHFYSIKEWGAMTEQERKMAVEAGLIYPEAGKDDVPVMPKHQAETMMMHMSHSNRNMAIVIIAVCTAMVLMALIFVTGYTSRTKDWLNTLAAMQGKPAAAEVQDGIQQQPGP